MDSNLIFGIRPVAEAIEAGKQIEKLYIRKGVCIIRRFRSRSSTA